LKKYLSLWILIAVLAVMIPGAVFAEGGGTGEQNEEEILEAPVILGTRDENTGKYTISWEPVQNGSGYEIYVTEDPAEEWDPAEEREPAAVTLGTSYVHESGVPGVTYYYRVCALSESGPVSSAFSNVVSGVCKLPMPKVTTSYETGTGATVLKWKVIEGAVSYKIYAQDLDTEGAKKKLLKTTEELQFTYTKGVAGHNYRYSVLAVCGNTAGNSAAKTLEKPFYTARPVIRVTYSSNYRRFNVDAGDTGYYVHLEYREEGGEWKYSPNCDNVQDTKLFKPGQTYEFRVRLSNYDFMVCSEWSRIKSCLCRLDAPSSSITTNKERPCLKWDSVTGATGYEIYRKIDGKYTCIAVVKQSGKKMSYTDQDSSLKYGTKYSYRIVACNEDPKQNSDPTSTRSITYRQIKLNLTELYTRVAPEKVGPLKVTGTSKDVTWSSSNTAVVTVKNGYLTAKKTGTATITAKVDGLSFKCKVKVLSDSSYVKLIAESWVAANITEKMSLQKKLLKASKAVMDGIAYSSSYSTAADALFYGGGDYKAGAEILKAMVKAMGYDASVHCMENDAKSMYPSGVKRGAKYYNVKVKVDGNTYYVSSEPEGETCYIVKNGKIVHREVWVEDKGWKDVTG